MSEQKYLDCELRLFLSVDIVNSTEYKAKNIFVSAWAPFINDFYKDFPNLFTSNMIYLKEKQQDYKDTRITESPPDTPIIWKRLGDEIVFTVLLKNSFHSVFFIEAFKNAVEQYRRGINDPLLNIKASAWIAGFPVLNFKYIPYSKDNEDNEPVDFIGPSIDIGFRISKLSTPYLCPVSVDLALLLTKNTCDRIEFVYGGKTLLKGVLGGFQYPLIFIKTAKRENDKEEVLIKTVDYAILNSFCEDYISTVSKNENTKSLIRPFINGDSTFYTKPAWYDEEYKNIQGTVSRSDEKAPDVK
ncbi:MAG: hypothetical protein HPY53_06860 [Brevinematales bacterium]|nr:hypothetical protein [Brevinematales bacterium]